MIELVLKELKHEVDAYNDFCTYRERKRGESGNTTQPSREDWLDSRRNELQQRMQRRRKRSATAGFG